MLIAVVVGLFEVVAPADDAAEGILTVESRHEISLTAFAQDHPTDRLGDLDGTTSDIRDADPASLRLRCPSGKHEQRSADQGAQSKIHNWICLHPG